MPNNDGDDDEITKLLWVMCKQLPKT